MRYEISGKMAYYRMKAKASAGKLLEKAMKKEQGVDGILVTVGLCIIALLLCVVMKDKLEDFIGNIMKVLEDEATKILKGVSGVTG